MPALTMKESSCYEQRNERQSDMKTQIMVAAHKPYWMPDDKIYIPIFVGAAGKQTIPKYMRDDQGENISQKNKIYCELTGLYWVWKNTDAEIYGLCHYRRYLAYKNFLRPKKDRILKEDRILSLLKSADIILPKKRHYWIETRESQYMHAHHAEDLKVTEEVLREKYPSFLLAWKHMLASRSGHICNMFIMRQELLDEYCNWLFDILFEVERRLDISSYSENDRRVFGFLGERLLDVWVETKQLQYVEVPIINLESQHWVYKGGSFIKRKITRKKICEKVQD